MDSDPKSPGAEHVETGFQAVIQALNQGLESCATNSPTKWSAIKPMLPNKPRGVPRVNDRCVLNGIFWVLRSGAPWRDLLQSFGPYTACYNRFVRWRRAGVSCTRWQPRMMHQCR